MYIGDDLFLKLEVVLHIKVRKDLGLRNKNNNYQFLFHQYLIFALMLCTSFLCISMLPVKEMQVIISQRMATRSDKYVPVQQGEKKSSGTNKELAINKNLFLFLNDFQKNHNFPSLSQKSNLTKILFEKFVLISSDRVCFGDPLNSSDHSLQIPRSEERTVPG